MEGNSVAGVDPRTGNQRTEEGEGRDASRSVHAHQPLRVKRAEAPPAEQRYSDCERSTRAPWKAHKLANYSN